MAQVFSTGGLFLESKNSSLNFRRSGLWAEQQVALEYLKTYLFLFHRIKTHFGEIDLGFVSEAGTVVIVEVKTLSCFDWIEVRLSWRQKKRLKNCYDFFLNRLKRDVEFHYILVLPDGRLIVFKENILD